MVYGVVGVVLVVVIVLMGSLGVGVNGLVSKLTSTRTHVKAGNSHPNVLFIIMEDLRPELSPLATPNILRIASKGVSFDLCLCQVSVCAPSRASLLTGLRPDTLGIYDFQHYGGINRFRTMVSHFQGVGYRTANAGKLFHWESPRYYSESANGNSNFDISYNNNDHVYNNGPLYWGSPDWENVQKMEMLSHKYSVTPMTDEEIRQQRQAQGSMPHDVDGGPSDELLFFRDSHIIHHAVRFLRTLSNASAATGNPWFLSVGLKGTHMQYQMPARFWDKFEQLFGDDSVTAIRSAVDIDGAALTYPVTAPIVGHVRKTESTFIQYRLNNNSNKQTQTTSPSGDREPYQRMGDGRTISKRGWKELYRGYLACLAYADYELGKLLDVVDELELWSNTVVVFTSDHGMHVGEKVCLLRGTVCFLCNKEGCVCFIGDLGQVDALR
jgi:iduronate 2-sulfatase